mmetsp:Transcript_3977/g.5304  ORF Transcript_3977/g.5304 Transcript_3977/m.5304 type:complete len:86 (-) Transcript_3977:664-921(-)
MSCWRRFSSSLNLQPSWSMRVRHCSSDSEAQLGSPISFIENVSVLSFVFICKLKRLQSSLSLLEIEQGGCFKSSPIDIPFESCSP